MIKKTMYISSEVYQQIRPSQLGDIEQRILTSGKDSMYPFKTNGRPPVRRGHTIPDEIEILEAYQIAYTNESVLNLITKSLEIVKNTEEGVAHTLNKLFLNEKEVKGIPPGTLRFYSQRHICFYTGRNWRKIIP